MSIGYHVSLRSLIFIPNGSILNVPLMYLFLILSFLVTPVANLNIFISATSISSTCFFVTATISSPYTIAGLTTKLYTFPFTLAGNPDPVADYSQCFSPSIPSCLNSPLYLPLTSSQLPFSCTFDPKYLNSFSLGTFVSSIFTVSLSFPPFTQ